MLRLLHADYRLSFAGKNISTFFKCECPSEDFFSLQITVPFKYEWLDEFFFELATYIFFIMTASKFRPALNNPYLLLTKDDEEEVVELDRM